MISSARSSAAVTGLPSAFDRAPLSVAYSSITAGPAASAARASARAMTSSDFDGITRSRNGSTWDIFSKYPSQSGSWPSGRAERSPTDRESTKIVAVPRFAVRMITGRPQ